MTASKTSQAWWYTPVIPATQEAEVGRSQSKVQDKLKTLSVKQNLKKKRLEAGILALASTRSSIPSKNISKTQSVRDTKGSGAYPTVSP
jgi:hypothetical protein